MLLRVCVLTFSYLDANFLEEGINHFTQFLFYGTQFLSGESLKLLLGATKSSNFVQYVMSFFSLVVSVHMEASSLLSSPDQTSKKLIYSPLLLSF